MSWLKEILEDNRKVVAGWPAWKRGESEGRMKRWTPDPTLLGGMRETAHGTFIDHHDLKQALAEKERELQQIREHEFQNGYREGEAAMMAQAVRFAKHCIRLIPYNRAEYAEAIAFLKEHP